MLPEPYVQLLRRIDPQARLQHQRELKGGLSAHVTALEWLDGAGEPRGAVLRRIGARAEASDMLSPRQQFELLQHLHAAGLSAPEPLLLDESQSLLPDPWMLLGFVPGAPQLAPAEPLEFASKLARKLAQIHACDPAAMSGVLPRADERMELLLARPAADARVRRALGERWPLSSRNPERLLHGDFWPGNVLWQGPEISGVIDWADAAFGDPLLDLSIARLELCWLLGEPAMDQFTQAYCAAVPCDVDPLPYWDLLAALRPGSKLAVWADAWPDGDHPHITEADMRDALDRFIDQALARV
ncbi:MAG TPA: phosphotransferase [Polyangiales bacterium]|nr:phosphotransferase [Polyangiales bacterium]